MADLPLQRDPETHATYDEDRVKLFLPMLRNTLSMGFGERVFGEGVFSEKSILQRFQRIQRL